MTGQAGKAGSFAKLRASSRRAFGSFQNDKTMGAIAPYFCPVELPGCNPSPDP
jgi:hypothetical protein